MIKYVFDQRQCSIPQFREIDHIIPAWSLTDAITKFARKHRLEMPAYWDEPDFDRNIELTFKHKHGTVTYHIRW